MSDWTGPRFTVEGTNEPLYVWAIYDHEKTQFVWPRYRDEELQLAQTRCFHLNENDILDKEQDIVIKQELRDYGFKQAEDGTWSITGVWGGAWNLSQHEAYMALLGWRKEEN